MTKGVSDGSSRRAGRVAIVIVVLVAALVPLIVQYLVDPSSLLMSWLLPHGRAFINADRPKYSEVDPTIQNLSIGSKL